MKFKIRTLTCGTLLLILMLGSVIVANKKNETIQTNSNVVLSKTKIEWGIKREDNHQQPDLGSKNRQLIEKYKGMAIGNKDSKNIYVTFGDYIFASLM